MPKMIESDKVVPLFRLLLINQPKDLADAICKDLQEVVDMHTVDAVRVVHGRWEIYDYDIYGFRNTGFKCSICGRECGNLPYDRRKPAYLYCPSCGAKMDEEDDITQ